MLLLDGKAASQAVKEDIKLQVEELIARQKRRPHLAAILVGTNGASETYVASKIKTCAEIGFESSLVRLDSDIAETVLLKKIAELNDNEGVDGILVQLPLPKQINEQKVIEAIH